MGEHDVRKGDWIVRHAPEHRAYLSLVTGVTTTYHDGRSPDTKLTQEFVDGFASPSEAIEAAFRYHKAARVFLREGDEYQLQGGAAMGDDKINGVAPVPEDDATFAEIGGGEFGGHTMKLVSQLVGVSLSPGEGIDPRSFAAGMVAGMPPMMWLGIRAWHAKKIAEHEASGAPLERVSDVDVYSAGVRQSFTFDEFERWINTGEVPS